MTEKEQFLSILEKCQNKINSLEANGYLQTTRTFGEVLSEIYLSNPIFFKENAELIVEYINENFEYQHDSDYKKLLEENEKH